jgi:hypothetical protein
MIVNIPLILKVWEIIFLLWHFEEFFKGAREVQFWGQKSWGTLKKAQEMLNYVLCPRKIKYYRTLSESEVYWYFYISFMSKKDLKVAWACHFLAKGGREEVSSVRNTEIRKRYTKKVDIIFLNHP